MLSPNHPYTVAYHYYGHDRTAIVYASSAEEAKSKFMNKLAERLGVKVVI